jgi:hypothetical protein
MTAHRDGSTNVAVVVRLASAASQDMVRPWAAALIACVLWFFTALSVHFADFLADAPLVLQVVGGAAALASFVLGLLAARHAVLLVRARHAIVGTDGVTFAGARDQVFVPFADLAEVRLEPNGVSLGTRTGEVLLLPVAPPRYRPERAASEDPLLARRNRLHDCIRSARRRHEETPRRGILEGLDRGDRSIAAWRADLLRLTADGSPYRGTEISLDELRAVVADPHAPAERRVAAAFVIAARSRSQSAAATAAAIQQSADPWLRIALHRASHREIDDSALARIASRQG